MGSERPALLVRPIVRPQSQAQGWRNRRAALILHLRVGSEIPLAAFRSSSRAATGRASVRQASKRNAAGFTPCAMARRSRGRRPTAARPAQPAASRWQASASRANSAAPTTTRSSLVTSATRWVRGGLRGALTRGLEVTEGREGRLESAPSRWRDRTGPQASGLAGEQATKHSVVSDAPSRKSAMGAAVRACVGVGVRGRSWAAAAGGPPRRRGQRRVASAGTR